MDPSPSRSRVREKGRRNDGKTKTAINERRDRGKLLGNKARNE